MQPKYIHATNGKEILESDVNTWSTSASKADDAVFAQLLQMAPFSSGVSRGILPSKPGFSIQSTGTGNGSVRVWPFRAFIGSTVLPTVDTLENWSDIRSNIYTNTATTVYTDVVLANNSSGNPRWDLIYARVDKDATVDSSVRFVKTISGTVISEGPSTLVNVVNTTVSIGVVQGTPGNPPILPTLPSDVAGVTYFITLAAVRVPNGFTSGSTVLSTNIYDNAPILALSEINGVESNRPANSLNSSTGAVLIKTINGLSDWGFTGSRPNVYMPPSMTGGEVRYIALDLKDASSVNWSQPDASIVDDTLDWRNRFFTWHAFTSTANTFPWQTSPSTGGLLTVGLSIGDGTADRPFCNSTSSFQAVGCGQSFFDDHTTISGMTTNTGQVCWLSQNNVGGSITSAKVILYVDLADGKLKFTSLATTPLCGVFIRLTASSQYGNA